MAARRAELSSGEDTVRLRHLEQRLLEALSAAPDNLVESDALIETLEHLKRDAKEACVQEGGKEENGERRSEAGRKECLGTLCNDYRVSAHVRFELKRS